MMHWRRIAVVLMIGLLGGCASSQEGRVGERVASDGVVPVVIALPEAEPAGPPVSTREVEGSADVTQEVVASTLAATARRVDLGGHRPGWWFDEAQWSEQRVTLCVETIGPDVLEVRRESVRAAREALESLIGEVSRDGEIVLTTVKPLPVPANVPGGHKYAGYVMITCVVPE
jgi:hypothetical protein